MKKFLLMAVSAILCASMSISCADKKNEVRNENEQCKCENCACENCGCPDSCKNCKDCAMTGKCSSATSSCEKAACADSCIQNKECKGNCENCPNAEGKNCQEGACAQSEGHCQKAGQHCNKAEGKHCHKNHCNGGNAHC